MDVYSHTSHRGVLREWLGAQPKKGRGVARAMAEKLRISSVLMSQILSGARSLQMDHAHALADILALNASETDYFLLLVQIENASTEKYRTYLREKVEAIRVANREVKNRVARDIQLGEEVKARFYSHWTYSAVRLLTDIPEMNQPRTIAQFLGLEVSTVNEILDFLVEHKLCVRESGRYRMAVQSTHLESGSPWIYSRQLQWRQKSIQRMDCRHKDDLFYTGPMVISKKDYVWMRERLLKIISELTERARGSSSETLACLNLDWFHVQ